MLDHLSDEALDKVLVLYNSVEGGDTTRQLEGGSSGTNPEAREGQIIRRLAEMMAILLALLALQWVEEVKS
jgi:hypothetical protein